jgi:hypothetical protein
MSTNRNTYILKRTSTYDKLAELIDTTASSTLEVEKKSNNKMSGSLLVTELEHQKDKSSIGQPSRKPQMSVVKRNALPKVQSGEAAEARTAELAPVAATATAVPSCTDEKRLSAEVVLRRARRFVEQADQIQVRRISPPQSLHYSDRLNAPDVVGEDVKETMKRPIDVSLTAPTNFKTGKLEPPVVVDAASSKDVVGSADIGQTLTEVASPISPSSSKSSTKRSPIRKFGFIGLWRRTRTSSKSDDQQTPSPTKTNNDNKLVEVEQLTAVPPSMPRKPDSPLKRKAFSWWRRTSARSADRNQMSDSAGKMSRIPSAFGGSSSTVAIRNPRSTVVAVATPLGSDGLLPSAASATEDSRTRATAWQFFDREAAAARDAVSRSAVGAMKTDRCGSPRSSSTASSCRAAIVPPFNYRPTGMGTDREIALPSSSVTQPPVTEPPAPQTKTAMLMERRLRRSKLAAASGCIENGDGKNAAAGSQLSILKDKCGMDTTEDMRKFFTKIADKSDILVTTV